MPELNSCDIADGMLLSGIHDGGELLYVQQRSGPIAETVSGPAYTVEFAPVSDPRPAHPGHYIDSVPSGSVVVIATSKESQLQYAPYTTIGQSLYGGLMSTRAQHLGAKGTVVLGQIRDLDEHRGIEYPVFSYGVGSCAANKTTKVVAVDQPLRLQSGSVISPGDIVYADKNGVVVVPKALNSEVVAKAEQRVLANDRTSADIKAGVPAKEAQAKWRKEYA